MTALTSSERLPRRQRLALCGFEMKAARPVSLYMVHEGFDERTYCDDIALARTQEELPLGRTVKRVIINRKFPRGAQLQLAGWGLDDVRDGRYLETSRLQWLQQSFKPEQACKMYALSPGMMCVESDINKRPSLGDSGGGLIANFVQQIGVLSFRHRGLMHIIIYMNVSYYYDWIQRGARQLICTKV
ncbi:serine protease SP24D-like [Cydia splendana]|uniref:serine protease SP24D-like n=1 Tax=Cydia splendana TaxID=1100963 RepID=UPI0028F4A7CE